MSRAGEVFDRGGGGFLKGGHLNHTHQEGSDPVVFRVRAERGAAASQAPDHRQQHPATKDDYDYHPALSLLRPD